MAAATSNCLVGFGKSGFRPPDGDPLRPDLKAKIKEIKSKRQGNYSYESGPRGVIFGPPSEPRGRVPKSKCFEIVQKRCCGSCHKHLFLRFRYISMLGPSLDPLARVSEQNLEPPVSLRLGTWSQSVEAWNSAFFLFSNFRRNSGIRRPETAAWD